MQSRTLQAYHGLCPRGLCNQESMRWVACVAQMHNISLLISRLMLRKVPVLSHPREMILFVRSERTMPRFADSM